MHKKRNGTIWPRIAAVAVASGVVVCMWLGVASANGDTDVTPTPTAAATVTAEITDNPVIEAPEVEDEGEKPETNAPAPTATATATTEVTDNPVIEAPEDEGTEEPTEEPVPPMEEFVDVTIGECQITITQKEGVDWTEVLALNGNPNHWGLGIGNETVIVRPVDRSIPLDVTIIAVIDRNNSFEYQVTMPKCQDVDPGDKPDPKSGESVNVDLVCRPEGGGAVNTTTTPWAQDWVLEDGKWVIGEVVYGDPVEENRDATEQECPVTKPTPAPTPTDPPTTGEPTDPPTSTPTPDPTDPPSGKPTGEPTKAPTTAPSGDPGSDKSDPKGPAKTGAIGDNSTDAILVGALAAISALALVAMRMGRRSSGKYAARS